jgi:ATP-dependent exoDNAse (exonuclease V) beta subunit
MATDSVVIQSEPTPADAPVDSKVDTNAPDRPQWLPEKFKSAEDLAKAYGELEKKLGAPKQTEEGNNEAQDNNQPEQTPEQAKQEQAVASAWETKFVDFSKEYSEKGQLSDQSFKKLGEMGYPREVVEAYIEGQKAIAEKSTAGLLSDIGGQENFVAMRDWAASNVPENELNVYNSMLEGSSEQAAMAVKGMYARYQAAQGGTFKQPRLLSGSQTQGSTAPFRSTAELTRAMSDPKYKADPAYRKEVEQRLSISNIL